MPVKTRRRVHEKESLETMIQSDPLHAVERMLALIQSKRLTSEGRLGLYLNLCGLLLNRGEMIGFVHDVAKYFLVRARTDDTRFSALTLLRRVARLDPSYGVFGDIDREWRRAVSSQGDASVVAMVDAAETGQLADGDVERVRAIARAARAKWREGQSQSTERAGGPSSRGRAK